MTVDHASPQQRSHLLLKPLALDIGQLLRARAHNVVGRGDVGTGLPSTTVSLKSQELKGKSGCSMDLTAFVQLPLQGTLTSRRSPASPAAPGGDSPSKRNHPSGQTCRPR